MRQWLGNARDGFGRQTWPDGAVFFGNGDAGNGTCRWPPFAKGEQKPDFFSFKSRIGVETHAKSSRMFCVPPLIGGSNFSQVQSTLEIGRTMLCLDLRYKETLVVKNKLCWYEKVKSIP